MKNSLNITPDTKVLIALTRTTMSPIDALCELIDNAIDSFAHAKNKGIHIDNPMVRVEIANKKDIAAGNGRIRVTDNGPGMTVEELERSIRAGYSGNNAYDNLGLFGMGFNISTGKLGVRTKVATAQAGQPKYILVDIDLNEINRSKSFSVPYEEKERVLYDPFFSASDCSGTVIEVSNWWPRGDANDDFAFDLARIPATTLRTTIGRRYSTILRDKKVKIFINNNECIPYEPCVWSSDRFVVKQGNSVPACMNVDEVVGRVRKCEKCGAEVAMGDSSCPNCDGMEIRTVEQRVWGWVGIQRFDDANEYGIDLIRNGRCICVAEKEAFFYYQDDSRRLIKDYPIDSGGTNGRIIGEIHMDFVPVGFTKENFERSSVEWKRAIECLRGKTSLQPSRVPEGEVNNSYIYKLYQAYRKVEAGPKGLYMGEWDVTKNGPVRISRDKEREYYNRFLKHEKGYFDDEEWYKLVESAIVPPSLVTHDDTKSNCPECDAELPVNSEVCPFCGTIILGKICKNESCGEKIPQTCALCPHCNTEQDPFVVLDGSHNGDVSVVDAFWACKICGEKNALVDSVCKHCNAPNGTENPVSEEYLSANSSKKDELSEQSYRLTLHSGEKLKKIAIETFYTNGTIKKYGSSNELPFVEFRSTDGLRMYIDPRHPQFARGLIAVKTAVAQETSHYIYEWLLGDAERNKQESRLSIIVDTVKKDLWPDDFSPDGRRVHEMVSDIMKAIKNQLADEYSEDDNYFEELDDVDKKATLQAFVSNKIAQGKYSEMCTNGDFLRYVPDSFVCSLFDSRAEDFFAKHVFKKVVSEDDEKMFGKDAVKELEEHTRLQIGSFLKVLQMFLNTVDVNNTDGDYLELVRLSANALVKKLDINV